MPERKDRPYFSVEEARRQFPNQHIVMDVIERGEHREPTAGEVLYHSKRGSAWRYLDRRVVRGRSLEELKEDGHSYYVFYGEEPDLDPDKAFARGMRIMNKLAFYKKP